MTRFWSGRQASWLVLSIALLTLAALPPAAVADGARVYLAPAQVQVGAGTTAAVEVRIENIKDLYAYDIRLSFDPAVAQVVDADTASEGVQVRPGGLLKADLIVRNVADNAAGTVWLALTQVNPTAAVSGSGVALVVTFRGQAAGKQCALTLTGVTLATRDGQKLAATAENGQLTVVEAAQAPATPTTAPTLPPPTIQAATATPRPPTAAPTVTAAPTRASASPEPTQTRAAAAATVAPTASTVPAAAQATGAPGPTAQPTAASVATAAPGSTTLPGAATEPSQPGPGARQPANLLLMGGGVAAVVTVIAVAGVWLTRRSRREENR